MSITEIDPETGLPIRNLSHSLLIVEHADDKDANGEWYPEAVVRYGNRYNDGSPMVSDEEYEELLANGY